MISGAEGLFASLSVILIGLFEPSLDGFYRSDQKVEQRHGRFFLVFFFFLQDVKDVLYNAGVKSANLNEWR